MSNVYKCLKSDFPSLRKRINRITKKLDKHNKNWDFEILGTSPERVQVLDYSAKGTVPSWQFQPKESYIITDVVSYTFEMEELQLGEYEVIAILEHNMIENEQANMIYTIKDDIAIPAKYRTIESYCEHCSINRKRHKTVLLQDKSNNIVQVGTTCINEYTGIDALDVISVYGEINDICINEPYIDHLSSGDFSQKYAETVDFLASSIKEITEIGYEKNETRNKAWSKIKQGKHDEYIEKAKEVISYFKNKEFTGHNHFLDNIKTALAGEYTTCNGLISYAYVAYQKELGKWEEQKRQQTQSNHVGNIKDRLTFNAMLQNRFTFGTNFSYYGETNFIYIFVDNAGNQYKWTTQTALNVELGEEIEVVGTVKAHIEYKGIKQTELTRCIVRG